MIGGGNDTELAAPNVFRLHKDVYLTIPRDPYKSYTLIRKSPNSFSFNY